MSIGLSLAYVMQCIPPNATWQIDLKLKAQARCIDVKPITYSSAGLNIFTDLLVLLLPVKMLKGVVYIVY
jgi:hypothetical protein